MLAPSCTLLPVNTSVSLYMPYATVCRTNGKASKQNLNLRSIEVLETSCLFCSKRPQGAPCFVINCRPDAVQKFGQVLSFCVEEGRKSQRPVPGIIASDRGFILFHWHQSYFPQVQLGICMVVTMTTMTLVLRHSGLSLSWPSHSSQAAGGLS